MANVTGVKGVVVSTVDGFELVAKVTEGVEAHRLAAMAGSIAALANVVGKEGNLGECRLLLVEASHGYFSVMQAKSEKQELVLTILAERETLVGQVIHYGKLSLQELIAAF